MRPRNKFPWWLSSYRLSISTWTLKARCHFLELLKGITLGGGHLPPPHPGGAYMRLKNNDLGDANFPKMELSQHVDDILSSTDEFHPCPTDATCVFCGERAGQSAFDWSFLDAAYCISLRTRPDRAEEAARQFHRVGLCRFVTFYRPLKPQGSSIIAGIWNSHRKVAAHALRSGCSLIAVFEDDVEFAPWLRPRTVVAIGHAIKALPSNWMLFFLGHWPFWSFFVRPRVLRTSSACAHAYVAGPRLLAWLVEHVEKDPRTPSYRFVGVGLDSRFAAMRGAYAFFPMIAKQSRSPSDHPLRVPGAGGSLRRRLFIATSRLLVRSGMRAAEFVAVLLSPLTAAVYGVRALRKLRSESNEDSALRS